MDKFIKPDYDNSVMNISSTLAEYFNVPSNNAVLPRLKDVLNENSYDKIVFAVFDGLGLHPMRKNLSSDDFLMKNVAQTLTSTFPSTTTNATTSINTDKQPLEHGWFGWTVYFDKAGCVTELFRMTNAFSGEKLPDDFVYPVKEHDDYWFDYAKTDYAVSSVMPSYCKGAKGGCVRATTVKEVIDGIHGEISKPGKRFVFAYCPEPDATMHEFGVTSEQAKSIINEISQGLSRLQIESLNTLFIVSADHGQTDVTGTIDFYKDKELNSLLYAPPYLEPRATAFKLKRGKKRIFKKIFTERYGEDFALFDSKNMIRQGYFGQRGEYGYLLGDYVAVCKTGKLLVTKPNDFQFKGHHASLKEEMLVPLILFSSNL